jgi:hypothetical protein
MNAAKYLSLKYWARRFFAIRPVEETVPQPTVHHFEIVPPEARGIFVGAAGAADAVLPEARGVAVLRLIRGREVRPEVRGIYVNAEERGVEA